MPDRMGNLGWVLTAEVPGLATLTNRRIAGQNLRQLNWEEESLAAEEPLLPFLPSKLAR